jgi:hypothetical protein
MRTPEQNTEIVEYQLYGKTHEWVFSRSNIAEANATTCPIIVFASRLRIVSWSSGWSKRDWLRTRETPEKALMMQWELFDCQMAEKC